MAKAKSESRELAQSYYLNTNMTQEAIAARVSVSQKTIGKWKEEDDWDMKKAIKTSGRQNIIKEFYQEVQAISDEAKNANRRMTDKEVLRIKNLTKSIQELDKTLALDTYIEVIEEYTNYLYILNPLAAKNQINHLDKFIDKKVSDLNR